MNVEPQSLENLISEFASLPGIGLKTARRLAYHMLSRKKGDVERFADSLMQAADALSKRIRTFCRSNVRLSIKAFTLSSAA